MKNSVFITVLLTGSLLLSSCATQYVLEKTNPRSPKKMPKTPQTEDYIQRESLMYAPDLEGECYYVEKQKGDRRKDYVGRIVGVPLAMAFDTVIMGLLVLAIYNGADVSGFGDILNYAPDYRPIRLYRPGGLRKDSQSPAGKSREEAKES